MNSTVADGVPHAELAALIPSTVDEQSEMVELAMPSSLGPVLRTPFKRASVSVLLHRRKMVANLTRYANNFLSFTILQWVISSPTPLYLLVLFPFLPPFTFQIQLKLHRFTQTLRALVHSQQRFFAWVCFHTNRLALIDFYISVYHVKAKDEHEPLQCCIAWCQRNSRNNRIQRHVDWIPSPLPGRTSPPANR